MILLIPYTRFTLKTYLPVDEVERQLRKHIEPRKLPHHSGHLYTLKYFTGLRRWWDSYEHKYFIGTLTNGNFNINRIIHYGNSFLPIIIGQIHDDLGMSRIEITMRLSYFVAVFVVVVFMPMLSGFLFSESGIDISGTLLFSGFMIFFYVMTIGFFNFEANKARRHLEEIFQVNTANFEFDKAG